MNNLRKRKDVMVGTNKYPNMNEKPVNPLKFEEDRFIKTRKNLIETHIKNRDSAGCGTALSNLSAAAEKGELMPKAVEAAENGALLGELADAIKQGSTECDMIKITRFSEVFEELRRKANDYEVRNGKPASAFLATFGALRDYKARADFSADFMRVGGLDIEPTKGFDKIEDAAKAYFETGHPVVVICSSDDKYPEIVPEFARLIKKGKPLATIVLAGYPKDNIEEFKEAGVDEFIHIRADIYDILSRLQNKIGM
jgi:methylmalonyl-CoA mutase